MRLRELEYYRKIFDTILAQASIFAVFAMEAGVSIHWDWFVDMHPYTREGIHY